MTRIGCMSDEPSAPRPHRIYDARVMSGLSLGQAARYLGLDRQVLGDIEWGRVPPGDLLPRRLAELYHVGVPWMLGETPESAPESALAGA